MSIFQNGYGQFYGYLKRGIVTREKDQKGLNRVKVKLIDENIEPKFASVSASFAGCDKKNKSGSVIIPKNGEEVIVGFLDGNINRPVILGSLYNEQNKPPINIYNSKTSNTVFMQFENGLSIQIDTKPQNQKVSILTESGNNLTLDDKKGAECLKISDKDSNTLLKMDLAKGEVTLKAKSKICFAAGDSSLTIDANKGVSVKSSKGNFAVDAKEVTLKSKSNLTAQAGAQATVKGNAGATLQSSGQTAVKGTIVQLN